MNEFALKHKPKSNMAFAYNEKEIELRFMAKKDDLAKVEIYYGDKYDLDNFKSIKMNKKFSDKKYDYFVKRVTTPNKRLSYLFKLFDKKNNIIGYFTEWKYIKELDINDREIFEKYLMHFPYINKIDVHKTPDWVKGAVFYQIFPERFKNGDDKLSPKNKVKWNSKPTRTNFFGGDLIGIKNKLNYLSDLGVNAIYLNPVFKATTNHKYDTIDYKKIDSHFGDKKDLKDLVKKAHSLNIKVVLDCVFNHSGYMFDKFLDVKNKGKKSKYSDWFYIKDYPISFEKRNYETFGFEPKMPKLNTSNPEVIDYLIDVSKYWIKKTDIDGWRLDVANETDHHFWRKFRKEVKKVKKDAFIVGEVWHNSYLWLLGDQFDSIMNYPIQTACLEYFAKEKIDIKEFKYKVNQTYFDYSTQVNEVMMNLLDSHDTPRFITQANGNKEKLILAFIFELFYLGCTSVYYGTEIGITGKNDPDCRKTMKWNKQKWDIDLYKIYKKLIWISNEYKIFKNGEFKWLDRDDILAFKRKNKNEEIIVLINNTQSKKTIELKNKVIDIFNDQKLNNSNILIESNGFRILKVKK